MKYLGTYQSNLSSWHMQELMKLVEAAIEQGEYAAGKTFDQDSLTKLRADGEDFQQLPTASAGQRVTDDSLNRPLSLLRVRFEALLREAAEFNTRAASLLAVLEKDSQLIDQLLYAASLEYWASKQPNVGASEDIKWDFGMGHGPVSSDIAPVDPTNSVAYANRPPVTSVLTDKVRTGLVAPADIRKLPVKYMKWSFNSTGEAEELYGADWTKLSLLEKKPLVSYASAPVVEPYSHPFIITGSSLLGSTPIWTRILFTDRRNQTTRQVVNDTPFSISGYEVSTDDVSVFANGELYDPVTDYTIDPDGTFTPLNLPAATDVTIHFVEKYPSYQCSINQKDWSPVVMLDAARPYPDKETQFHPIAFGIGQSGARTAFPLTDETGTPTGLFIELGPRMVTDEFLLKVSNPASQDSVGSTAVLEIEFERPAYLNAVKVAPFTTFPVVLKRIEAQGLTEDTRQSVYEGSAVLDRETTLRFDRTHTRRLFLTFYQENYSLKDHEVESTDALRREVMNNLQSALPYAARRAPAATPISKRGAQYEFGVENLEGQDWTATKGVFVSGPHRFTGCPEIIRVDADLTGTVDFYLCYRAYNAAGVKVDENVQGVAVVPERTIVFPFADDLDRGTVHHTDVYLKIIHRDDAMLERFLIQVANV